MRVITKYGVTKSFELEGYFEDLGLDYLSSRAEEREKEYFAVLNKLVNDSVKEAADIKKSYKEAMANDNKISAQERSILNAELDELLISMVKVHERLRLNSFFLDHPNNNHQNLPSFERMEFEKLSLVIENRLKKFTITGVLKERDIENNQEFSYWHDDLFLKDLKEMLYTYHESIADNILTEEEINMLSEDLTNIIYDIILMKYLIQYLLVSK